MAKDLTGKSPGGGRNNLIDILPLDTPLVIQVFPIYACNFKCFYCGVFNKPKEDRFFISDKVSMEVDLFKSFVDGCSFKHKIKVLRFVGVGEPLLHPDLSDMVKYAKDSEKFSTIEIITNGSLLNKKVSDNLTEAGLDRLVVSLQGVTSEAYKKVSNVYIDFLSIVDNIKYFYNLNKSDTYVKVADIALRSEEEREKFYNIFDSICDSLAIEHIVPIHGVTDINEKDITQFCDEVKDIKICPLPFYFMEFRPDGNVVPCYSFEAPVNTGNLYNSSITDIWYGRKLKEFRLNMINNSRHNISICKSCGMSVYRYHKEDFLDAYKTKLLEVYN